MYNGPNGDGPKCLWVYCIMQVRNKMWQGMLLKKTISHNQLLDQVILSRNDNIFFTCFDTMFVCLFFDT